MVQQDAGRTLGEHFEALMPQYAAHSATRRQDFHLVYSWLCALLPRGPSEKLSSIDESAIEAFRCLLVRRGVSPRTEANRLRDVKLLLSQRGAHKRDSTLPGTGMVPVSFPPDVIRAQIAVLVELHGTPCINAGRGSWSATPLIRISMISKKSGQLLASLAAAAECGRVRADALPRSDGRNRSPRTLWEVRGFSAVKYLQELCWPYLTDYGKARFAELWDRFTEEKPHEG